jgi:hypothetical protein
MTHSHSLTALVCTVLLAALASNAAYASPAPSLPVTFSHTSDVFGWPSAPRDTPFTLTPYAYRVLDPHLLHLPAEGALRFTASPSFVASLNAIEAQVSRIGSGAFDLTRNDRDKFTGISRDLPVGTLDTSYLAAGTFQSHKVGTEGGLHLTTIDNGITATGGVLSITNIQIDLAGGKVYGDVWNGRTQEFTSQLHLWNGTFTSPTTTTALRSDECGFGVCRTEVNIHAALGELQITAPAFQTFVSALGMTEDGVSVLRHVTDYGTLVAVVPEASTVVQMGLGLAGLAALSRRRRKPSHA